MTHHLTKSSANKQRKIVYHIDRTSFDKLFVVFNLLADERNYQNQRPWRVSMKQLILHPCIPPFCHPQVSSHYVLGVIFSLLQGYKEVKEDNKEKKQKEFEGDGKKMVRGKL